MLENWCWCYTVAHKGTIIFAPCLDITLTLFFVPVFVFFLVYYLFFVERQNTELLPGAYTSPGVAVVFFFVCMAASLAENYDCNSFLVQNNNSNKCCSSTPIAMDEKLIVSWGEKLQKSLLNF